MGLVCGDLAKVDVGKLVEAVARDVIMTSRQGEGARDHAQLHE